MEESYQTISNAEVVVIAILFGIFVVLGCFLNGLVVATYLKWNEELLTEAKDFFILSLAVGDFLLSLLAFPFAFSSVVSRKWTTGHSGCVFYGFITTWIGLSSMLQLTAMAVERCVTLSELTLNTVSKIRAILVIGGCWFLALVASLCPLLGWSKYTFEGYGLHCSILWDSQTADNASYNLFLMVMFFVAPIVVIVVSYVKIYSTVRDIYLNAGETWGSHAYATQESYKAQVKAAKQLLLVIAGFMFAWTPYAIVSTLKIIGGINIPLAYHEYPSLCAKMSALYNPLIYFFFYSRLRVKAIQTLKSSRNVVHPEMEFDSQMANTVGAT